MALGDRRSLAKLSIIATPEIAVTLDNDHFQKHVCFLSKEVKPKIDTIPHEEYVPQHTIAISLLSILEGKIDFKLVDNAESEAYN